MVNIWQAPAKINLFLHVLGKRPDGYHNLQSVFQLLNYCDQLSFKARLDGKIKRLKTSHPNIKTTDDLVIKAAKLLKKHTKTRLGADISIDKKIPIGGGLGGGSSNAATTLVALNQLWQTQLKKTDLMHLGRQLGADVCFFIKGQSAWAEGVGDKLTPLKLKNKWFLVLFSGQGISTQKIFSHPLLTTHKRQLKMSTFVKEGYQSINTTFVNDCLPAAIKTQAEISTMIDWLNQMPTRLFDAVLTGTGACVFSAFDSVNQANEALKKLPACWHGFVAKGLSQSPLYE